jgi:hypothetical protein
LYKAKERLIIKQQEEREKKELEERNKANAKNNSLMSAPPIYS